MTRFPVSDFADAKPLRPRGINADQRRSFNGSEYGFGALLPSGNN